MNVEFFDIDDAPRMAEALAIRFRVFVEEQGVPPDLEIDEHDRAGSTARHALVRDGDAAGEGGTAIAAGRLYAADATTAQIGRLAVLAERRGRGVGALLLDALVDEARRGRFARAHLWAQTHAVAFYHRAGFRADGALLSDAGIPHQPMTLDLAEGT